MKFSIERDVLADAVSWVARVVPSRPPVPVLAGVRVEAGDNTLSLAGFDYEQSARVSCPAEVGEPGTVVVSGRLLAEIVRSLPKRPVEVALDGSKVIVRCGASRFTLLTMPVDEYPTLPELPDVAGAVCGGLFAEAVAQVAVAASRDETLPVLTGVLVEPDGDTLTLMATDRYRLAVRTIPWTPAGDVAPALIQARTLTDAVKHLDGRDVTIRATDGTRSMWGLSQGRRHTTTLLLDGDYPRVRALFPAVVEDVAVVDRDALTGVVGRVAIVAERNTPIRLTFADGQVTVTAGQGEDAQATETLDSAGGNLSIAFNPQYLLDGLGALSTPYARFSFTKATKPAVITGQATVDADDDTSYRYLIMPVRLAG